MRTQAYNPLGIGAGSVVAQDYEVVRRLTGDSRSVTWQVVERVGRTLKVLRLFSPEVTDASVDTRQIMEHILAAQALSCPYITVIERILKTDKRELCLVYENFEGTPLCDELSNVKGHSVEETVYLLCGIARAIQYAQGRKVNHLHLRPTEIFLTDDLEVVVSGYGLGKIYRGSGASGIEEQYAAPEQLNGALGDLKSDIFSWGLIGFELLTGSPPDRSMEDTAPLPSLKQLSQSEQTDWLAGAIDRALQIDLSRRMPKIEKILSALEEHLPKEKEEAKQFFLIAQEERERMPGGRSQSNTSGPNSRQLLLLIGGVLLILLITLFLLLARSAMTTTARPSAGTSNQQDSVSTLETIISAKTEIGKMERAMESALPDQAQAFAAKIKADAKLPVATDDIMIWEDIIALDRNSLDLTYRIIPANSALLQVIADGFSANAIKTACGSKIFIRLMDGRYKIRYVLNGNDGRAIKLVDVSLADCGLEPLVLPGQK